MLPRGSRCAGALDARLSMTDDQLLLVMATNALREVAWLVADARRDPANRPKPIVPAGFEEHSGSDAEAIDADEYLETLARMRGGRDVG